jgi:hypothetical protein
MTDDSRPGSLERGRRPSPQLAPPSSAQVTSSVTRRFGRRAGRTPTMGCWSRLGRVKIIRAPGGCTDPLQRAATGSIRAPVFPYTAGKPAISARFTLNQDRRCRWFKSPLGHAICAGQRPTRPLLVPPRCPHEFATTAESQSCKRPSAIWSPTGPPLVGNARHADWAKRGPPALVVPAFGLAYGRSRHRGRASGAVTAGGRREQPSR